MTVALVDSRREIHALYAAHHGWLVGWLRRRLSCVHSADDLAQDTFVRIVTSVGTQVARGHEEAATVALDLREPRAYLTTVAKRVLSNHSRRQRLEDAYLASVAWLPERSVPSPEERLVILQTLEEIDDMLDGLAPKARTAFLMAQFEGLTYAEIAGRLNVAVRTVKRYMAQAFEQCLLIAA
jgi:RNA polymerase sigma-70 factor (ECF subfamily)